MSDTIASVAVEVVGRETVSAMLAQIESRIDKTDTSIEKLADTLAKRIPSGTSAARNGFLSMQSALARNEALSGNYTGAIARLEGALRQENTTAQQTIAIEGQLIRLRQQAEAAANRQAASQAKLAASATKGESPISSMAGSLGTLTSVAGTFGVALGARELINYGVEAGKAGLELRNTEKVTRQIAGTQDTYNQILGVARKQQELFGGSLNDNLSDLSSFAVQSRTSGASLESLISTAQRLAQFDPGQGIRGASLALREALAGNPASLAARFEIPRAALAKLRDESATTADRLAVVNEFLTSAGIPKDVTNSVDDTTKAYNRLAAELDNLKTSAGAKLADVVAPVAKGANNLLTDGASNNTPAAKAVADSTSFDDYTRAANQASLANNGFVQSILPVVAGMVPMPALLGLIGGRWPQLTQAQFDYAKSLIATGVAQDEAIRKAQEMGPILARIAQIGTNMPNTANVTGKQIDDISKAATKAAATVPNSTQAIQDLFNALAAGDINAEQLIAALNAMTAGYGRQQQAVAASTALEQQRQGEIDAGAASTKAAEEATKQFSDALVAEAEKKLKAKEEGEKVATVQADIARLSGLVAQGLISPGDAALELARKYNIAFNAGVDLVNINAQLAGGSFGASGGKVKSASSDVLANIPGGLGGNATLDAIFAKGRAAAEAQREYDLALGSTSKKLSIYQGDLDKATKLYGANSAQAIKAKQALDQFNESLKKKGGAGGGVKLSDQAKLNNSLAADQAKADDAAENAERQHQQKLLDITKEFAERRAEAQRSFDQAQLEGRGDFYGSLFDIESAKIQQASSAAYEQASQKAGQIAQEQGADVAEKYMDAQEQIILARAQRQAAIEEAEKKKDSARAEALRGVDALKRRAEDAKLNDIEQGRGSINQDEQKALADADADAARRQDEIGIKATQAGDRKVDAAERAGKAIDVENTKLQAQADLLDRIGGRSPTTAVPTSSASDQEPIRTPAPVPESESKPQAPAVTADTASLADIRDVLTAALGKLDAITAATRQGADKVAQAVASAPFH